MNSTLISRKLSDNDWYVLVQEYASYSIVAVGHSCYGYFHTTTVADAACDRCGAEASIGVQFRISAEVLNVPENHLELVPPGYRYSVKLDGDSHIVELKRVVVIDG